MLFSPDPLGERLALMWHNHFATSNRKVDDLAMMHEQNEVFRELGRAHFGELLSAVVKQPATLVWLDADSNRKGHPNENLARELLELFTLGIGNYSESDVQEAARALTGWTVSSGKVAFNEARHDEGDKTVLDTTGPLTGDDVISVAVKNPATARRLAWRICRTFLGESVVSEESIDELATGLYERDLDVDWGVETILRSRLFFADANLRSSVAGPVEFVMSTLHALELTQPPPSTLLLAEWIGRMGQELFYPPNVGGWTEGRSWLTSRSIIARANFASALVEGRLWHPPRVPDFWTLVHRHRQTDDLHEAVEWLAMLLWGESSPRAASKVLVMARGVNSNNQLSTAVAILVTRPESQLT
jgi:uncharacterized protein (DUF1800 family)